MVGGMLDRPLQIQSPQVGLQLLGYCVVPHAAVDLSKAAFYSVCRQCTLLYAADAPADL